MQSDGGVPLSSKDNGSLKSKFKIARRSKRKHLGMDPRAIGVRVALQTSDKKIVSNGPKQSRDAVKVEGLHAIDPEGIDIFCVVAPRKRPSSSWAERRRRSSCASICMKKRYGGKFMRGCKSSRTGIVPMISFSLVRGVKSRPIGWRTKRWRCCPCICCRSPWSTSTR